MEIAVVQTERQLTNKRLSTLTQTIAKCANGVMSNYAKIGTCLAEVNENKLYKDDFETFEAYVSEMFNMSRKTAYRIIKVTKNLILPDSENKFFLGFSDSALAALTGAGDYEEAVNFCEEHNITELSTVREINAALKEDNEDTSENGGKGSDNENLDCTDNENSDCVAKSLSNDLTCGEIAYMVENIFRTARPVDTMENVVKLLLDLSSKTKVNLISETVALLSQAIEDIGNSYESED